MTEGIDGDAPTANGEGTPAENSAKTPVVPPTDQSSISHGGNGAKNENSKAKDALEIATFWVAVIAAIGGVVAACFTGWQVCIAKDSEDRQMRAYVGPEGIELEMPDLKNPNYAPIPVVPGKFANNLVRVKVKNYGQTQANSTRIWLNWHFVPFGEPLPRSFAYPDMEAPLPPGIERRPSVFSLFPGQEHNFGVVVDDIGLFIAANQSKSNAYLYGHIDYIDVFNTRHVSKFCYFYEPMRPPEDQFTPCAEHFNAD